MKKYNIKKDIAIGQIEYSNVAPIYYSFDRQVNPDWLDIVKAPPSVLNKMMSENMIDISPISSFAYAVNSDKLLILPDISISCDGKVMSVLLVSRYPLEKLHNKKILLTQDSAAAAGLSKLIFSLRQIDVNFETGRVYKTEDVPLDCGAALVIGDAALKVKWEENFEYIYDLGDVWKDLTGLPFVFALWVIRKSFANKYPDIVCDVIDLFALSKNKGKMNINEIALAESKKLGIGKDICEKYYNTLKYDLDSLKIKGLQTYFDGLYKNHLIHNNVNLEFYNAHHKSCAA